MKNPFIIGIGFFLLTSCYIYTSPQVKGNESIPFSNIPEPLPLMGYRESSIGLVQPGMEGGPAEIEPADTNKDGNIDLLSLGDHGNPNINTQEHGIMTWFNDGNEHWVLNQTGDFGYGGIAIGDINNDNMWDLAYSMHHDYSSGDLGDNVMEAAIGDGTGKSWTPWGTGLGMDGQLWACSAPI